MLQPQHQTPLHLRVAKSVIDARDSSLGAVRHLTGGSGHEDLWGAEEMTSSRWRIQLSRGEKFLPSYEKNHCNWSNR
ncbi:hypothetical protein TNCV_3855551 [Trichonephila clavipes]|nr:hypothetical protein TNCV_3855551 [Trichonephila clavipes]